MTLPELERLRQLSVALATAARRDHAILGGDRLTHVECVLGKVDAWVVEELRRQVQEARAA